MYEIIKYIYTSKTLYLCTMCRRSKRILGEHGGGGVVARAKVQTVKVKSLSLLFSYVDVVFIPDTTCGEGVKFFQHGVNESRIKVFLILFWCEKSCFCVFFGVKF